MKMPSMDCEVKGPSVEFGMKMPSVDCDVQVKMPSMSCDMDCDVDVGGKRKTRKKVKPVARFKGGPGDVKAPSMECEVEAAKMPSMDCEVKGPSVEFGMKMPSMDYEV